MSIQMQQLLKQHQTQQFLTQQFSSKQDKQKHSNLIPEQQNEKCFNNKLNCETHKEESPSHRQNKNILKPCQKPQQQNHTQKSNITQLQNQSNIITDMFSEKFNRQRSQSPNSLIHQSQINDEQPQRRPASFANDASHKQKQIQKSPHPQELQESLVTSIQDHQKIPYSKIGLEQKLKSNYQQLGSFCQTKQYQQGCPIKSQSHSSTNSISYNSKQNFTKKPEQTTNYTPTKLTTNTLNTEYSKSKSINKDQCNKAIIYDQDKKNDLKILNVGTPSTYLHSKVSIEQQSVDESLGNKFQQGKLLCQYSPLIGSDDNLENVLPSKTCTNHRNKKAKYKIEEFSKFTYFCSQCAIEAASQGKVVQEINQLKIKSSGSQIPTFQSKLIEINGNVNLSEMQFKERLLSGFLKKLETSQTLRQEVLGQMKLQIETIKNWYEVQMRKCEESKEQIQNLLNEVSNYCITSLQMQQQESLKQIQILQFVLEQHKVETNNIQQDIENNWNAVLRTIKMEPFQKIMDNHQIELIKMNEFTQSMLQITIGLKQLINPDIKPIMALIAATYQLQDEKRQLIQSNIPKKIQQISSTVKKNDNFEMPSQQLIVQQRIRTNFSGGIDTQPDLSDRQQNSNTRLNVDNINQVSEQKQQKQKNNYLYVSFEDKDLFMNIIDQESKTKQNYGDTQQQQLQLIESQEYKENQMSLQNSPKSTPHSPASGQMKQSIERTVNKTEEGQQQICSDLIKQPKTTFRKLFENTNDIQTIEVINNESLIQQEQNTKVQQQNKISNIQSKQQQFFQESIESNQKIILETPDLKKNELENLKYLKYLQDTETCKKALEKRSEIIDSVKQVNQWDDEQKVNKNVNMNEMNAQKILNFKEHLSNLNKMTYIMESAKKNINTELGQKENEKSLFSSPQFKDQDIIKESEKRCISN